MLHKGSLCYTKIPHATERFLTPKKIPNTPTMMLLQYQVYLKSRKDVAVFQEQDTHLLKKVTHLQKVDHLKKKSQFM